MREHVPIAQVSSHTRVYQCGLMREHVPIAQVSSHTRVYQRRLMREHVPIAQVSLYTRVYQCGLMREHVPIAQVSSHTRVYQCGLMREHVPIAQVSLYTRVYQCGLMREHVPIAQVSSHGEGEADLLLLWPRLARSDECRHGRTLCRDGSRSSCRLVQSSWGKEFLKKTTDRKKHWHLKLKLSYRLHFHIPILAHHDNPLPHNCHCRRGRDYNATQYKDAQYKITLLLGMDFGSALVFLERDSNTIISA